MLGLSSEPLSRAQDAMVAPLYHRQHDSADLLYGDCRSQWKTPIFAPLQLGNPFNNKNFVRFTT